jgi:hypothetical protein
MEKRLLLSPRALPLPSEQGIDDTRQLDRKRKQKLEGSQLSEKSGQLKMLSADGKYYNTDVHTEQILRLIQSIPSPNGSDSIEVMVEDKTFFALRLVDAAHL